MHPARFSVALLLLAAACSSPRPAAPDFKPLVPLASHPLQYRGQLATEGLPLSTEPSQEPASETVARVAVTCRAYEIETGLVNALVDTDRPWLRADSVSRKEVESLFARFGEHDSSTFVRRAELMQPAGKRGTLAITSQTAFVKAYKLQSSGSMFMADPEIGVGHEGMWMGVSITDEAGDVRTALDACTLDLELHLVQLQRPIVEATGSMPGIAEQMTLQLPLFATQKLQTTARVQSDEALLVGPVPGFDDGHAFMFVLTTETWGEDVVAQN